MCASECISQSLMVHAIHHARPLGCGSLLPRLRPEGLAIRNRLQRDIVEVVRVFVNRVTPPIQLLTSTGIDDGEKDDKSSHGETEVESEREDVVVSHPPHEAVSAEVVLEDETDQPP